jgi:AbrB family looped-hinge helix DNA binding protein
MLKTKAIQRNTAMPIVKVRDRHQVTIPKEVVRRLSLKPGDFLEVDVREGKGIFTPKRVMPTAPVPKLSPKEQKLLQSAKKKIEKINKDVLNSKGLTPIEADIAAKVGLIDPDQKWFWLEGWQKRHREAERDIKEGRTYGPFATVEEFIADLRKRTR